jgi:hypothetical protein
VVRELPDFWRDPGALEVPWFQSPFFDSLLEHVDVPADLVDPLLSLARRGYCVVDPQLPSGLVESVRETLEPRFEPPRDRVDTRISDAWSWNEHVMQIATLPRVLEILRVFYQREAFPFQTLNFQVGTEQATHSDAIHFSPFPQGFMCGVWVALEDVDESNGPLHYYPGSHELPVYDLSHLGIAPTLAGDLGLDNDAVLRVFYKPFIRELVRAHAFEKAEAKLQKGQAIIWAANLLHGGSPILDRSRTRHSQVTHYYFDGCLYHCPRSADPWLSRPALRPVRNLVTRRPAPQWYAGRRVLEPGRWPLRVRDDRGRTHPPRPPMSWWKRLRERF